MNNYYTLHSLVAEIRYEISGMEISEVWSNRRDQIDFFFQVDGGLKLTFSAASSRVALFPDRRAAPPSQNAASFFPELRGSAVTDIFLPDPGDRFIQMTFADSASVLLFQPFGSRPNVLLLRHDSVVASFKNSQKLSGSPAPLFPGPDTATEGEAVGPELPLRKRILAIDRRFPRGIIGDVTATCGLESLSASDLTAKIRELGRLMRNPESVSITAEGHLCLLPERYLVHPPAQTFPSVSSAVRTLFLSRQREVRVQPDKKDLDKRLSRRISGLQRQREQRDRDGERCDRADELEQTGHLLMSQPEAHQKAVSEQITVTDWTKGGEERTLSVTPGQTLVQQAQNHYARAARIRKEVAMSAKKRDLLETQLRTLQKLHGEVNAIEHPAEMAKWLKKNEGTLQQIGLGTAQSRQVARPYRLLHIENFEVWIGKNARSNDEILALSHKEDIWMHARGTAGSHVVIRTRGDTGWPDVRVVQKVACWAAAYSKQAGSSLVPVMVAKRKHVRKPKGAAPGMVAVTRERVEMVPPLKPDAPDAE